MTEFLAFVSGLSVGLIVVYERTWRLKEQRDMARQERDQFAAGTVSAIEGRNMRVVPVQTRRWV